MSKLLYLCVSSLRRGHANLLCIVSIVTGDPRRESRLRDASCYLIVDWFICRKSHNATLRRLIALNCITLSGFCEESTPFAQALALQSHSRNCNPAPGLVL